MPVSVSAGDRALCVPRRGAERRPPTSLQYATVERLCSARGLTPCGVVAARRDAEVARCAEFIETPGTPSRDGIKVTPDSPLFRAWTPMPKDEDFNSDDWFRGEFASANGHGNARAIATLYGG